MQKPLEVRIETPYEQRIREQQEKEAEEAGAPPIKQEKKDKSPEEIKLEREQVDKSFRDRFSQAYKDEVTILESALQLLSQNDKFSELADKVLLASNHYRLFSTKWSDSKVKSASAEILLNN